jgi:hypothetical protein
MAQNSIARRGGGAWSESRWAGFPRFMILKFSMTQHCLCARVLGLSPALAAHAAAQSPQDQPSRACSACAALTRALFSALMRCLHMRCCMCTGVLKFIHSRKLSPALKSGFQPNQISNSASDRNGWGPLTAPSPDALRPPQTQFGRRTRAAPPAPGAPPSPGAPPQHGG